jgi:hypothetical protein
MFAARIAALVEELKLSPVELLELAREAAHDHDLLSVHHLRSSGLLELLRSLGELKRQREKQRDREFGRALT